MLSIVLVLPHPAAADECAAPFDPFDVFKPEAAMRDSVTSLALYRCNGGLHLVDLSRAIVLTRINPGWWFDSYDSSAWNEAGDELTVNAQFITGNRQPADSSRIVHHRQSSAQDAVLYPQ